jgi:3'(2'), 5'-bisphosphate nucleotidase
MSMTRIDRSRLLESMVNCAVRGGAIVWDHFNDDLAVERKADESPVTAADRASEAEILAGLSAAAPGIPVVAEEETAAGRIPEITTRFFLVDPLDGTKEFIQRTTDFTVNIGLIENGAPTLGVVYAPARAEIYWGDVASRQASGADWPPHGSLSATRSIGVRQPATPLRAVASKSHCTPETEAWLVAAGVGSRVSIGSSLKFALVASGEADVYPRPAPTMEWDTAAGDAVLRAAGGRVFDIDGRPLQYGKTRFFNPGFIATGTYDPVALRPFMRANGSGTSR